MQKTALLFGLFVVFALLRALTYYLFSSFVNSALLHLLFRERNLEPLHVSVYLAGQFR